VIGDFGCVDALGAVWVGISVAKSASPVQGGGGL